MTYLYSRDSKGKIRIMTVQVVRYSTHYEIRRSTGLLDGKLIVQPVIEVHTGKVNRTTLQQAELETRSIVNKQRDKGYKLLEELVSPDLLEGLSPMDYDFIDSYLPKDRTDSTGERKLMLAKDISDLSIVQKVSFFNGKDWWVGKKLDGVRAGIKMKEDGTLYSISRGGKNFDVAFGKIFKSKKLKDLLKKLGSDAMIDGELYIHGTPLPIISGIARKEEWVEKRHGRLEFWIFDYGNDVDDADTRGVFLNRLQGDFDPDYGIKINSQVKLSTYSSIKVMHDLFVKDGFEGAICREGSRLYGWGGKKDSRMVKLKEFQDDEFPIIGIKAGLRDEDMCFSCITKQGMTFEAKPIGPRELKFQYLKDEQRLIGKMLTVKFFNYTEDGIPFLPIGKAIRDYE